MTADTRLAQAAADLGYDLNDEIRVGGHYVPLLRDGAMAYVSGQLPRVGSSVLVTGRVGESLTLAQAQHGARICILRALTLLQRELGSLAQVRQILRLTVYVQSAADFTQHSEVADGASDLLHTVLAAAGRHTRTSVGVYQLPKNAGVELDLVAALVA